MGADMKQAHAVHRCQRGFTLVEVLVSLLVFSIGVLGMVGLQARAIQFSVDAEDRSKAAMVANEVISWMWATKDAGRSGRNDHRLRGSSAERWPAKQCRHRRSRSGRRGGDRDDHMEVPVQASHRGQQRLLHAGGDAMKQFNRLLRARIVGRAQRGMTLIELLVAMLISLVLSLAIFGVLASSEGLKRTTTSVNDINQTGNYAMYTSTSGCAAQVLDSPKALPTHSAARCTHRDRVRRSCRQAQPRRLRSIPSTRPARLERSGWRPF